MFAALATTSLDLWGPNQVGNPSATQPLIVPTGYAFSIWGIIYLGLLGFTLYQLAPTRAQYADLQAIRAPAALNMTANGAWLIAATYNWLWVTVGIILVMLFTLIRINQVLQRSTYDRSTWQRALTTLPWSIYFAWVTLATVLNIAAALQYNGWQGGAMGELFFAVLMLSISFGLAVLLYARMMERSFLWVFTWAFLGIFVARAQDQPLLAYLALAFMVLSLLIPFVKQLQPRHVRRLAQ